MRHEHVVEDHDADGLAVFGREFGGGLAGPAGGTRDDGDAGRVDGHRAAHREIAVLRNVGSAGHHQELMHIGRAGDDRLGAPDDDAVGPALLDVEIDIAVDLLARAHGAVALGVGHRDAQRQVAVLNVVEIAEKALAVVGAVTIVGQPGRLEDAVQRVMRQIALRAAGRPADQTDRLELVEQIRRILVDVEHAVDGLARRALARRHDRHVLLLDARNHRSRRHRRCPAPAAVRRRRFRPPCRSRTRAACRRAATPGSRRLSSA